MVRDLRADIAAEAGARQTYEALIKIAPDDGSKKALHFLLTREISHTNMFMKALDLLGKLDRPAVRPRQAGRDRRSLFQPVDQRRRAPRGGRGTAAPAFKYVADPEAQGKARRA